MLRSDFGGGSKGSELYTLRLDLKCDKSLAFINSLKQALLTGKISS